MILGFLEHVQVIRWYQGRLCDVINFDYLLLLARHQLGCRLWVKNAVILNFDDPWLIQTCFCWVGMLVTSWPFEPNNAKEHEKNMRRTRLTSTFNPTLQLIQCMYRCKMPIIWKVHEFKWLHRAFLWLVLLQLEDSWSWCLLCPKTARRKRSSLASTVHATDHNIRIFAAFYSFTLIILWLCSVLNHISQKGKTYNTNAQCSVILVNVTCNSLEKKKKVSLQIVWLAYQMKCWLCSRHLGGIVKKYKVNSSGSAHSIQQIRLDSTTNLTTKNYFKNWWHWDSETASAGHTGCPKFGNFRKICSRLKRMPHWKI